MPSLCKQLSPQTLGGSTSKDFTQRFTTFRADICTTHPRQGVAFQAGHLGLLLLPVLEFTQGVILNAVHQSSLPTCAQSRLTATNYNHFLNPHHQSSTPAPTFFYFQYLSPKSGRICQQSWMDLQLSKFGWKSSRFGCFGRQVSQFHLLLFHSCCLVGLLSLSVFNCKLFVRQQQFCFPRVLNLHCIQFREVSPRPNNFLLLLFQAIKRQRVQNKAWRGINREAGRWKRQEQTQREKPK